VRAFVIDWAIIMFLLVTALFAAVSANSDRVGRILGFAFLGVWLLYEPLLVSFGGSTVGHYLSNLRVVDDRTHGNVSFLKGVARLVIKTVLGIYSFITMAMTLRHQAVHDLITRSTVQIRDRAKASPHHYIAERTELLSPVLPSPIRRMVVVLGYLFAVFALYVMSIFALMASNLISLSCGLSDRCSGTEDTAITLSALIFLGTSVLIAIQGWRGRLFGCRARVERA
jgi:RDD family